MLYFTTLLLPIIPPTSTSLPKHLSLHRHLCGSLFALLLVSLVIHPLPGVFYTITTYLSPPSRHTDLVTIGNARIVVLVLALLVGGSMRRGPKLHYERMRMATGFGLNEDFGGPTKTVKRSTGGDEHGITEAEEEEVNVLDWSNSSMLAFVSLFYVSPSLSQR